MIRKALVLFLLLAMIGTAQAAFNYSVGGVGYNFGQQFNVNVATGVGAITNYPVPIIISNASGVSTSSVIYTNGTTRPTWTDLVFSDVSDTPVTFFLDYNQTTTTTIPAYVNYTIPAPGVTGRIYFGNASATTSPQNPLPTVYQFAGQYLNTSYNQTPIVPATNVSFQGKIKPLSATLTTGFVGLSNSNRIDPTEAIVGQIYPSGGKVYGYSMKLGTAGASTNINGPPPIGTYNFIRIDRIPGTATYFINGTVVGNITTNLPSTPAGLSMYAEYNDQQYAFARKYVSPEPQMSGFVSPSSSLAPTASFTSSANPSAAGTTVTFTDTSTGTPTKWNWSFDNRTTWTNESTAVKTNLFATPGAFNVTLVASNPLGESFYNLTQVITNATSTTEGDVTMTPTFTLLIHVTDSSNGLPIPTVTVSDGATSNTTVLGTTTLFTPYGISAGSLISTGYVSRAFSIVMDSDQEVTYQMTPVSDLNNYAVTYPPKDVRFHVQTVAGTNIQTATIVAQPYQTTLGNYEYVATLFGYNFEKVPLANRTLTGVTDSKGDISFAMMADVQYSIYTTKAGYTFTNFTVTPHDDNYIIYPDYSGSLFVTNGTAPSASVTYRMVSTRINNSVAVINVSYVDIAGSTIGGCVTIYRGNRSYATGLDTGVNFNVQFSGNSTWQNFTIMDIAGTSQCPQSTSVILTSSNTVMGCYNQTNVEDRSYMATTTGYTPTGNVYATGTTWFRKTTNPIAGLSSEFALFIALFLMMFTALMATKTSAPAISLVVTFEGWVFYGWNMFAIIDPIPLYTDLSGGSVVVPAVLTIMTFVCFLWLFVEYRRSGK